MNVQLATLAQASVLQLREAIRRVTSAHAQTAEEQLQDEFLAGVETTDASWDDWQETSFDVRKFDV
jgi:hypothetical protein